jgi:DNA-binding XRE family transcriptional regulator
MIQKNDTWGLSCRPWRQSRAILRVCGEPRARGNAGGLPPSISSSSREILRSEAPTSRIHRNDPLYKHFSFWLDPCNPSDQAGCRVALSRSALAAKAKTTHEYVNKLEAGRYDPTLGGVQRLAKPLGVTLSELVK